MKCISSPALENIEIARYVDGEAEDAVVAHIKECPFCSDRARQWTLLQKSLRKQFYRKTCPTPAELGDYHLGLLPARQVLAVAQHIRECALCRQEVLQLEEYLAELAPERGLLEPVKILIGRIISGQPGELSSSPALRGETKGPLIFAADGIVVTLDVQPGSDGGASLQGQVAADDQDQWTGAVVKMSQADMPDLTASLDDLGSFGFEGVHPGTIHLRITSHNGIEVQILNIDIVI
jgi:hypothetical protein